MHRHESDPPRNRDDLQKSDREISNRHIGSNPSNILPFFLVAFCTITSSLLSFLWRFLLRRKTLPFVAYPKSTGRRGLLAAQHLHEPATSICFTVNAKIVNILFHISIVTSWPLNQNPQFLQRFLPPILALLYLYWTSGVLHDLVFHLHALLNECLWVHLGLACSWASLFVRHGQTNGHIHGGRG